MKKYLNDLEAELRKLNISDDEIAEILEDHKEMLEEAVAEGLSDDEIALKFGDPDKLAKELKEDGLTAKATEKVESVFGTENLQGYELIKSLPTMDDLQSVNISLISEDLMYFPYEGESIEVYVRGKYREEEYNINYKDGTFNLLRKKGKVSFNPFGKKTPDFGVRVPVAELNDFKLNLISGDANIQDIKTNEAHIKTVSGDVLAVNLSSSGKVTVSVVSGDADFQGVTAKGFEISMVSGDLKLTQAKFDELIHIGTVSGDTKAKHVSVPEIELRTVSGDFKGNEVYCDKVTLKSVSGDVVIENTNKDHHIEVVSKKSLSGHVTIK